MILHASDDLSIGPFVAQFPGSAQTAGCQSCSTWETRRGWTDARTKDEETVSFLRSPKPLHVKAARGGKPAEARLGVVEELVRSEMAGRLPIQQPQREAYVSKKDNAPVFKFGDDTIFKGPDWCQSKIAPPPFSNVAWYTQLSFFVEYGVVDWPAAPECQAPCLNVSTLCSYPSINSIPKSTIIFPDSGYYPEILTSKWGTYSPYTGDRGQALAFVELALALLNENIDLVEWVVCLAYSWNPRVPRYAVSKRVAHVLKLIQGEDMWVQAQSGPEPTGIFLVQQSNPTSTGWATSQDGYPNYKGRVGVVIPINHPVWQDAMQQVQNNDSRGLCAIAVLAETIIHEACHLASDHHEGIIGHLPPPQDLLDEADDALLAWAPQNMASISFLWALAQRYPCLQNVLCCPKTGDQYFMTSEPNLVAEVLPWAWVQGAVCT